MKSFHQLLLEAVNTAHLTPAFWKWFGNSKVVDKEENPLVVYHGTRKAFTEFSRDKIRMGVGFFFTSKKKYCSNLCRPICGA